jgi:hypothetical protein
MTEKAHPEPVEKDRSAPAPASLQGGGGVSERLRDGLCIGVLAAACFVSFMPLILHPVIPHYLDPVTQSYPSFAYLHASLREGRIPLWNPNLFAGMPFLADVQNGVWSPLHLLAALVPDPALGYRMVILLSYLGAGIFTFLFLRRLGACRSAALSGALVYMLGGYLFRKIALPLMLRSAAFVPAAFYCTEIMLRKPRKRNFCAAALVVCFLIVSGFPQIAAGACVLLFLYALLHEWIQGGPDAGRAAHRPEKLETMTDRLSFATALVFVCVLGFAANPAILGVRAGTRWLDAISFAALAILLLRLWGKRKTAFAWKETGRKGALAAGVLALGTLLSAVQLLPAAGLIRLSKNVAVTPFGVVGRSFFPDLFFGTAPDAEASAFIGLLPAVAIFYVLLSGHGKDRRFTAFCAFAFVSLLVVLKTPAFYSILRFLPGLRLMPYLGRYAVLTAFSAAVLTGVSLHAVLARTAKAKSAPTKIAFAAAAPVIIFLQLFLAGRIDLRFAEFPDVYPEVETVKVFRAQPGPFRIFGWDHPDREGKFRYSFRYETPATARLLFPNYPTYYGVEDIQGYNTLQLKTYADYFKVMNEGAESRMPFGDERHFLISDVTSSPMLNLLNLKYIVSKRKIDDPNLSLLYQNSVRIYENQDCLPRFRLFGKAAVVEDSTAALEAIRDGRIDASDSLVLSGEEFDRAGAREGFREAGEEAGVRYYASRPGNGDGRITQDKGKPEILSLNVEIPYDGFLFVSEVWDPGWKATVDGDPAPLLQADGTFRAVYLRKGSHAVVLRYRPAGYFAGAAVSAASLGLLILFLI